MLKIPIIHVLIITVLLPLVTINSTVYGITQDPKKSVYEFDGYVASASWSVDKEDGTHIFYYLNVYYSKHGTDPPFASGTTNVGIDRYTYLPGSSDPIYDFTNSYFQGKLLTIDNKLNSATLSPVSVTFIHCEARGECPPTGETPTVQASWTGHGTIFQSSVKSKQSDAAATYKTSQDSKNRDASASISIGGQQFQADSATLTQSKHIEVTKYY